MKGITVQLAVKTVTGYDPFGAPIETEELVDVPDVIVGRPDTEDVTNTIQLYGKRIEYVLGIPKGDTHNWTDATIYIWGQKFRSIGYPETGIQDHIPLRWGQNVRVERYG